MAANLVKAGHEVAVWNRSADKEVEGARTAASPADAAKGVEVVWMCVSDTKAVERVLFGPGGAEPALAAGMIIADSSTISPSATLRFAERVKARGVDLRRRSHDRLEDRRRSGSLIFMVGGRRRRARPPAAALSSHGKAGLPHGRNRQGTGHEAGR